MEIHPKVNAIQIGPGICLYLVQGQKIALVDTGPKQPMGPPPGEDDQGPQMDMTHRPTPDDGKPPVMKVLPNTLQQLGIGISDIDYILNSHIHFDHTAGNAAVQEVSGAKILIHEDDAEYFDNPRGLFDRELAPVMTEMLGEDQLEEEYRRYISEATGPGPYVPVHRALSDNDVIELGDGIDLKVVHLPGHTPGSIGFYWEEEGILIAGDASQTISNFGGGLPILDDFNAYQRSMERMLTMSLKTLAHAHPFGSYTVSNKMVMKGDEIKTYLTECLAFSNQLKDAATGVKPDLGKKPLSDLYDNVVSQLPESAGLKSFSEMRRQYFSPGTLLKIMLQLG